MSSMKYPYRDLGVTFDRQFRNDLNANFDDIEHDIRQIGGEAAQQALEAADEANTQAIYAQTSGDYANDKGDYAAQQGDYAQTQGNFANEKGLYAQQQGDYAKAQGDYAKQVGDENKTRWLNPIATFADIATTYPNPQHGDTVMVTDDGENSGSVYRYENGQWNLTQKHNDLAIADVQNKIGILFDKGISIEQYPRLALEVTDSPRIQRAIDDLVNKNTKIIHFPKQTYEFSTTVTVKTGTKIIAYGAVFSNTSSHIRFLELEDDTAVLGVEIVGAGAVDTDGGRGINIQGTDSATYKKNILIQDCYIHDIGFYGIYAEFAENVKIINCWLKNIGYAAILGMSVKNVKVDKALIKNISPGQNGNAYGVAFSRSKLGDLTQYPRSQDCTVTNSLVEDITLWEGLDTHAGENISFINNTVRNCKVGIAIISDDTNAPNYCKAIGNTIFGIGTGAGILVVGANNVTGSPFEYAKGCVVKGNTIYNAGEVGNNINGGIKIHATLGVVVSSNTLIDSNELGINIYADNKGFVVSGNTIIDVKSNSWIAAGNIVIRAAYNEGVIDGNAILLVDATKATYVSERGIYFATTTNNKVHIGNNFNTAKVKQHTAEGQNVVFGSIGQADAEIYTGLGSPEGVITAKVGSLYIRRDGGVGTTFYVKESGTGNTGWVAK